MQIKYTVRIQMRCGNYGENNQKPRKEASNLHVHALLFLLQHRRDNKSEKLSRKISSKEVELC